MKRQLNQVPSSLKNINVKALLRSRGIYELQAKNKEMKKAAIPAAKALVKARQKPKQLAHPHLTDEQVTSYVERQIHIIDVLEKRFDNKLQQFIGKMVDSFLGHLESEIATTKSMKNKDKDYFADNEDDLLVQAQIDFTPLLQEQALLAGNEALKLINSKDIYTPFKLREVITENVAKFTKSMIDTDRQTLINIISNGIESGQSLPQIRGEIQTSFESITKSQAQRITRTEVTRTSVQAQLDAYTQSGVVEALQWVIDGAIDECADYDGQIITLGDNFYDSDNEFQDGNPPLHPNCRCQVVPILVGEKGYTPKPNEKLHARIVELEEQLDKRTKAFREAKAASVDDAAYIKALENLVGTNE